MVELIQKIPIPSCPMEDSWSWIATNSEFFFLSSSLFGCVGMALLPQISTSLEARFGDPKFMSALHLWRIAANVLPTKEVISMFNENMDGSCPLCNSVLELPFV